MRAYFDASVIIAAFLSPFGGSAKLLIYRKLGAITAITSQTVVEEVLEKSEKLQKSREELENFIAESGLVVYRSIEPNDMFLYGGWVDPDDIHLIAGAKLTKCTHLVTLDKKHLLRPQIQKQCLPLVLLSPKELLERIIV